MRVNIYIKDEDIDLWEALENKSAFVSDALRGTPKEISPPSLKKESPIKIPAEVNEAFRKTEECKNGHILNKFGNCSQKGCKYA